MQEDKDKLHIGIDVSKDSLDIYCLGKSYKIQNDTHSILEFINSNIELGTKVFCVMESTGGYERVAAKSFASSGFAFHIAHPSKVHAFAKACGHFAKTDKLDAILLYKYAVFISDEEDGDIILDETHQEIISLRRLSRSIEENLHKAQCRLKQMPASCHTYLKKEIAFCKTQIEKIQKEINEKIDNHPGLKAKRAIMITMTGVAKKTASILLAELAFHNYR